MQSNKQSPIAAQAEDIELLTSAIQKLDDYEGHKPSGIAMQAQAALCRLTAAAAPPEGMVMVPQSLLKFVQEVEKYTDPWAINLVEHPEVFRKAMKNINTGAKAALAAAEAPQEGG